MEAWKEYKLGDLFERVIKKNTNLESENVLTISAQYGLINQEEFFNKPIAGKNLKNYYLLEKGEFAYNKSYSAGYPVGATKMLNKYNQGIVSTLYICFKSKSDFVNNEYFEYYFESKQYFDELSKIVQEGARNHGLLNINVNDFFDIKIKVPDINKQKQIVKKIKCVDNIIEKIIYEIKLKENLKQGIMKKIFEKEDKTGWKMMKIKQIGDIITGTTPPTKNKEFYSDEFLWVTPSDIDGKEINFTQRMLSRKGLEKGRYIPANSLLVTCIASIGKNTILRTKGSCNQQINAIIPNKENDVDFLYYLMEYNEEILHKYAGNGGMEILNKEDFSNLCFYIPKIELQKNIANVLSKFDYTIQMLKKKENLYINLKKGLMQQLLTGKVRTKI